jgi:hypothetical protein
MAAASAIFAFKAKLSLAAFIYYVITGALPCAIFLMFLLGTLRPSAAARTGWRSGVAGSGFNSLRIVCCLPVSLNVCGPLRLTGYQLVTYPTSNDLAIAIRRPSANTGGPGVFGSLLSGSSRVLQRRGR